MSPLLFVTVPQRVRHSVINRVCGPLADLCPCMAVFVHRCRTHSGSAHMCQNLSAFISGIWGFPGAPAGKGPASSSLGRAERWLRGSGEGLGGDDAASLGGHAQLGAGVVPAQGAGSGKPPWGQRLGSETS